MRCLICEKEMHKIYKDKNKQGVRCIECDYEIWFNHPKAQYLFFEKGVLELFKEKDKVGED